MRLYEDKGVVTRQGARLINIFCPVFFSGVVFQKSEPNSNHVLLLNHVFFCTLLMLRRSAVPLSRFTRKSSLIFTKVPSSDFISINPTARSPRVYMYSTADACGPVVHARPRGPSRQRAARERARGLSYNLSGSRL